MEKRKSLLTIKNYPAWLGVDTFLLAGSAVHWIIMSVMAYQLSGSLAYAGWFSTIRGITSSVTQIVGGTFIDRHNHRLLMIAQSSICCVLWTIMGLLFITGNLTFALFVALCLSSSVVFGFLGGTTNAALIRIVGPERYPEAESVNQGRDALVNTAGSPLGAVLFGLNQAFPFFASAVLDGLAFLCALTIDLPDNAPAKDRRTSPVTDMIEGFRWVLSSKLIVSSMLVVALVQFSIFGTMQAVNLNLVSAGTEPLLISLTNIFTAAGMVLGSIFSTKMCTRIPVGKGVPLVAIFMALSYLPMIVVGNYVSIAVSLFLMSLPVPLFSALLSGFAFSKTPFERQGRTRSVIMCFLSLFASMSGAFAGEFIGRIGFQWLAAAMASTVTVAAILMVINPLLRRIPSADRWDEISL